MRLVVMPDTTVVGLVDVMVCGGSVIAITTALALPSTAAAYVPPADLDQQILLSTDAAPVACVLNVTVNVAAVSELTVSWPVVVPARADDAMQSLPEPTILIHGAPLVWKFVPANVIEVAVADTAVAGLIQVTVCGGSVIAITTESPPLVRAAVYAPSDVVEKQILFPEDAVPVAIVLKVRLSIADVSDVATS